VATPTSILTQQEVLPEEILKKMFYDAAFKLRASSCTEQSTNRGAARKFSCLFNDLYYYIFLKWSGALPLFRDNPNNVLLLFVYFIPDHSAFYFS